MDSVALTSRNSGEAPRWQEQDITTRAAGKPGTRAFFGYWSGAAERKLILITFICSAIVVIATFSQNVLAVLTPADRLSADNDRVQTGDCESPASGCRIRPRHRQAQGSRAGGGTLHRHMQHFRQC